MKKKIWLVAGIAGMLFSSIPQFTAQAHYGDGYEHRHGRDEYRYERDYRYGHHRPRYDRYWYEEERRRRWREEERRRHHHHDHDRRSGVYIRL